MEYKNWCIHNKDTGRIVDSGYSASSAFAGLIPTDRNLDFIICSESVDDNTHYVDADGIKTRVDFVPDWSGSTLLNCPDNAALVIHSPSGQVVPAENASGVVHMECIEQGQYRVHVDAWPYLEWIGEITPSEPHPDTQQTVSVVPFDALDDARDQSVLELIYATRRARNRSRSIGKSEIYERKQSEVLKWVNAGQPESVNAGDYPWGFAEANQLSDLDGDPKTADTLTISIPEVLELWNEKTAETETAGIAIETYEKYGKADIRAANSWRDIVNERDFYVSMLDQL